MYYIPAVLTKQTLGIFLLLIIFKFELAVIKWNTTLKPEYNCL